LSLCSSSERLPFSTFSLADFLTRLDFGMVVLAMIFCCCCCCCCFYAPLI
jgi:hypothetical protein